MPAILSTHIQLTLECHDCGHVWDIDDEDSNSILDAITKAEDEKCPECHNQDNE